jgi:hypothetical protein
MVYAFGLELEDGVPFRSLAGAHGLDHRPRRLVKKEPISFLQQPGELGIHLQVVLYLAADRVYAQPYVLGIPAYQLHTVKIRTPSVFAIERHYALALGTVAGELCITQPERIVHGLDMVYAVTIRADKKPIEWEIQADEAVTVRHEIVADLSQLRHDVHLLVQELLVLILLVVAATLYDHLG